MNTECRIWVISGHAPPENRLPLYPRKQTSMRMAVLVRWGVANPFYRLSPRKERDSARTFISLPQARQNAGLSKIPGWTGHIQRVRFVSAFLRVSVGTRPA